MLRFRCGLSVDGLFFQKMQETSDIVFAIKPREFIERLLILQEDQLCCTRHKAIIAAKPNNILVDCFEIASQDLSELNCS